MVLVKETYHIITYYSCECISYYCDKLLITHEMYMIFSQGFFTY